MAYTQSSCGCTKPEENGNRCPLRKIKSIAKSGDYVIVTFDDCTFLKASFNVVDDTFGGTTLPKLPETDAELKKEVDSLKTKVEELGSKEAVLKRYSSFSNKVILHSVQSLLNSLLHVDQKQHNLVAHWGYLT